MTFYNKFYFGLGIVFMVVAVFMLISAFLHARGIFVLFDEPQFVSAAGLGLVGASLVVGYLREMKRQRESDES